MNFYDTFKSLYQETPAPPTEDLKKLSNLLSDAINDSVCNGSFAPGVFSAKINSDASVAVGLKGLLLLLLGPVESAIAVALVTKSNPTTPDPILAWQASGTTILSIPMPVILKGEKGIIFWNSVLLTIKNAIPFSPLIKI